jgi:transcriptional regulator of met regulon
MFVVVIIILMILVSVILVVLKKRKNNNSYTLDEIRNNDLLEEEITTREISEDKELEKEIKEEIKEEVKEIEEEILVEDPMTIEVPQTWEGMFRKIDLNNDGTLQRSEIVHYRDGLSLEEIWKRYDEEGYNDGNLMDLDKFIAEEGDISHWSIIPKQKNKKKRKKKRKNQKYSIFHDD